MLVPDKVIQSGVGFTDTRDHPNRWITVAHERKAWSILFDGMLIGNADLAWFDDGMGIRGGKFRPGPAYERVRSTFQSFAAADNDPGLCRQYYRDRDALGLTIADDQGGAVSAIVHIIDFNALIPDSELEIELYPSDE